MLLPAQPSHCARVCVSHSPHPITDCQPASGRAQVRAERKLPLAVLPLLTLASAAASAQPPAPPLQQILVTERSLESTLPLELSRYGADLEIVTDTQVRNHGFVDIAQTLEMLVPGMHLTTQAGAFSYVNVQMQGSRTSDILWTVDGVRINNRLYNSTSPADTLPSAMIERTEVLKGGHGLMYGTQAIAGVINVVTRGFSDTPDAHITLGSGSHGAFRANVSGRTALGDHKLVAWASRDQTDGYEIYDNYQPGAVHRKRAYEVDSVGLKYGYDLRQDLHLSLTGIHTEATLDYPNVSNVSVNDRAENILIAKLDYVPAGRINLLAKAYFHSWDTDYYTPPGASDYWGYDDKGFTAAAVINGERWFDTHIGYDFQSYSGQDDVLLIARQREEVNAVYAQWRSRDELSTRARFAAGVRYNKTGGNDATVWNASGVYDISERLYVQGIVSTSFVLPSAENLYRIHCPTGQNCTHGNPALAAEESIGVNLAVGGSVDVVRRTLHWQLSSWERRVDHLITTAPIPVALTDQFPAGFTRTFVNLPNAAEVSGAEVLLNGPLSDSLSFDVSYTYSKEIDRLTGQQIQDRPRRQYRGALAWSPGKWPVGANIGVKYIGEKTANVTGFGVQRYGGNTVVDAGLHAWLDAARKHRVTLRLENLLDEDYATAVNSAVLTGSNPQQRFLWQRLAPPRTLHLNYSYQF